MKLFLLKPHDKFVCPDANTTDNPWKSWYDKCFGLVVRATSPNHARRIAHDSRQDSAESRDYPNIWLDPNFTSCEHLTADGEPGVIITDVWEA